MSHKGNAVVPGYGTIRQLSGITRAGRYRVCHFVLDFGHEAGQAFIQAAVDDMTKAKIHGDFSGEPSSMRMDLAVDTRGQSSPKHYARVVGDDLIDKLVAAASNTTRTVRRHYKPVRTSAQRGLTSASAKR